MFKNAYKIIVIKEGKFDLKQISISPLQIGTFLGLSFCLLFAVLFLFSDNFINWVAGSEIKRHQENNKELLLSIKHNQSRVDSLLEELHNIKKYDDMLRKLVKLPPIHDDIRKMGYGGGREKNNDINYLLPERGIDINEIIEEINYVNRLINLEFLSYNEISKTIESNIDGILSYPAIHPVSKGVERLSSNFGYRRDPFSKKYKFHEGNDYSARIGTSVHTTANGRVKKSKYWGSFGNYIEIDHGNGYVTAYGHLSSRDVKVGDKVFRGQKIGEVGNTGRSTAPHLHYEVQYRSKALDPSAFYFDSYID